MRQMVYDEIILQSALYSYWPLLRLVWRRAIIGTLYGSMVIAVAFVKFFGTYYNKQGK